MLLVLIDVVAEDDADCVALWLTVSVPDLVKVCDLVCVIVGVGDAEGSGGNTEMGAVIAMTIAAYPAESTNCCRSPTESISPINASA